MQWNILLLIREMWRWLESDYKSHQCRFILVVFHSCCIYLKKKEWKKCRKMLSNVQSTLFLLILSYASLQMIISPIRQKAEVFLWQSIYCHKIIYNVFNHRYSFIHSLIYLNKSETLFSLSSHVHMQPSCESVWTSRLCLS